MKHSKKLLSLLITASMAISLIPATVMADTSKAPENGSTEDIETEQLTIEGSSDNSDALFAGYVNRRFGIADETSAPATKTLKKRGAPSSLRDQLTANEKHVYDSLLLDLQPVLEGTQTSTALSVAFPEHTFSFEELDVSDYDSAIGPATEKAKELTAFDANAVIYALLYDHPYEMFWYDKTAQTPMTMRAGYASQSNSVTITLTCIFEFPVAKAYSATNETGTLKLGNVMTAVNEAVTNANTIVANSASLSDREKLIEYKNKICDLTSYNTAAAHDDTTVFGDPWQMIYVFDGDSGTNVVCEGYAKAFKYLCDQSDFTSDNIGCYLVSGKMWKNNKTAEAHMWNIVTLEDGKRYLADVTNCDTGSIGAPDLLFLTGYDGKTEISVSGYDTTQYDFWTARDTVHYYYDKKIENAYQSNHQLLELVAKANPLEVTFRHTCSFLNTLAVNYYVKESDLAGYSDIYLEVSGAGFTNKIVRGSKTSADGENYYRFALGGIYTYSMGSDLTAVLHATKDGEEFKSERDVYSVKQYAYNTLKLDYGTTFKRFMVDMLNYGSAVVDYAYVDPTPEMYMNKDLTNEQKAWGTSPDATLTSETTKTYVDQAAVPDCKVAIKGYQAYLSDSIAVNVKMSINQDTLDDVKMIFTYTSKATGEDVEVVIPSSKFTTTNEGGITYYWAKLESIVAQDARTKITAKVFDGDRQISYTYEFSVEIYMAGILKNNSSNEILVTLVHKLMNYCISAENYFAERRG